MISKQYIKELDFETIEDIYNYIVESEINGNYAQCKELINKLSKEQYKEFILYCDDFVYFNNNCNEQIEFKNKVINWRQPK